MNHEQVFTVDGTAKQCFTQAALLVAGRRILAVTGHQITRDRLHLAVSYDPRYNNTERDGDTTKGGMA